MASTPAHLWVITLVGMVGIPGLTSLGLYRGALLAGLGQRRAVGLGVTSAVLLGGWFTASGVIAAHGGYRGTAPWLPVAFTAALVALLAATRIPPVARALTAPGALRRLELPHTFRVAGVAFLISMALGQLPALFALPAGLGDIAVGIAAPFVARRVAGTSRRAVLWFTALGIADLVVALTLGGLTGFGIIATTPSGQAIAELPLALIPTAAVPLLLTLHLTALRQIPARTATPTALGVTSAA